MNEQPLAEAGEILDHMDHTFHVRSESLGLFSSPLSQEGNWITWMMILLSTRVTYSNPRWKVSSHKCTRQTHKVLKGIKARKNMTKQTPKQLRAQSAFELFNSRDNGERYFFSFHLLVKFLSFISEIIIG